MKNNRLINALQGKPVDCTPVWLMRQAGRYLPEYRSFRSQVENFMDFCKIPELACEATLQPLARFDVDAAIIFSDILTIPEAMGMELSILPDRGPILPHPIQCQEDVDQLVSTDVNESLAYVMKAIALVRQELAGKLPLIGFSGSPWTLACYMVEGCGNHIFHRVRAMLYRAPEMLHTLLIRLTEMIIAYLNAQIEAGVEVIMVFDTWGGLLTPQTYQTFSLYYLTQIARSMTRHRHGKFIPLIFFTKQGGQWLEMTAKSGCDAVGLDWTIDIGHARALVGDRVALQGNLDPAILLAKPQDIQHAAKAIIQAYGPGSGHVFNLGHGVHETTPPDHVGILVDAVHQLSYSAQRVVMAPTRLKS